MGGHEQPPPRRHRRRRRRRRGDRRHRRLAALPAPATRSRELGLDTPAPSGAVASQPPSAPASAPASGDPGAATAAPSVAAGDLAGAWLIAGGEAGYRVRETFLQQKPRSDAVGRTEDVTGSLTVEGTPGALTLSRRRLDRGRHDDPARATRTAATTQLRGRGIQSDTFPTSTFELATPSPCPADFGSADVAVTLPGKLTLHGVTKDVEIAAQARLEADGSVVVAGSPPDPLLRLRDRGAQHRRPHRGPGQRQHGVPSRPREGIAGETSLPSGASHRRSQLASATVPRLARGGHHAARRSLEDALRPGGGRRRRGVWHDRHAFAVGVAAARRPRPRPRSRRSRPPRQAGSRPARWPSPARAPTLRSWLMAVCWLSAPTTSALPGERGTRASKPSSSIPRRASGCRRAASTPRAPTSSRSPCPTGASSWQAA